MEIRGKYGDESLAGFACSRSANEDIYMVQKMVRTCFGNNNTDNCARVCHSATVAGLMNAMGYPQKHMTSAEVMDEIAALTPSYHGISHARLDAGESLQWSCLDKNHPGTPIMHTKGPVRGRALFRV